METSENCCRSPRGGGGGGGGVILRARSSFPLLALLQAQDGVAYGGLAFLLYAHLV